MGSGSRSVHNLRIAFGEFGAVQVKHLGRKETKMSISAIDGLSQGINLWQLLASAASAQSNGSTCLQPSGDSSNQSQVISRLEQLQASDPTKFKQVMSDIVAKLQEAAAQQSDAATKDRLNLVADRFKLAADTGDMSVLKHQGHHGHHGHHSQTGATQGTQDQSTLDIAVSLGASPQSGTASGSTPNFQQMLAMEQTRTSVHDIVEGVLDTANV